MLAKDFALKFAADWVSSWNSHDLDAILAHYDEEFSMHSPRIALIAGEPSGVLHGKRVIREYWKKALDLTPNLHFSTTQVFVGADSIAIAYIGPRGPAMEVFQFGPDNRVVAAFAHY